MSRNNENQSFVCENCNRRILPLTNRSYRNHCPFCLCSKHVDVMPGDRINNCGGLMIPVGVLYKSGKGYQIMHRCLKCGTENRNVIAENTIQADDLDVIISLCM